MYECLLNNQIDVNFMDSSISEYVTTNIYCNLTLVGDGLNAGSFYIVMPKGWLYEKDLDAALLSFKEANDLENLYRKWFEVILCSNDPVLSGPIDSPSLVGLFMLFRMICASSIIIFT